MALTREQFLELRNKGLSVQQIIKFEKGEKSQEVKTGFPEPIQKLSDIGKKVSETQTGILKGIGKGAVSTLTGISSLGERGIRAVGRAITPKLLEKKLGFEKLQPEEKTSAERLVPEELRTPEGFAQKIGFGGEQLAEWLLPSSKISKLEKGRKLITRAGIEATTFGGITAAQKGEVDEKTKTAAIIGAMFPIAGAGFTALKKGLKPIGEKIQYSVIRPSLKDVKDGFKIENINKYNVGGSLGETATKTHIKLNELSKELSTKLGDSTGVINLNKVYKETVDDLLASKTKQFGDIKGVNRVLNNLKEEIGEVAGKNGLVDLIEATSIKRGAGTKGSWAFGRVEPDASSIEKVYTKFYNKIKVAIEKSSPENIKEINKQMSELIPVSNAVLRRLPVEQRNNIISLTDSIGLFASIFDPRALALIGAKKLSRSGKFGQFLINVAKKTPTNSVGKRIFGQ